MNLNKANNNSPYPGLRPYREDEKDNFFGRDADREILVDKLLGNRLTLLFAATGVGKSSLLQAAVMPQLKDPLGENLTVIYHNDWVSQPIDSLKQSIVDTIKTQDIPLKEKQTLPELLEFCTLFTRHPLVIILDQFEEFFRYQKQGDQFHEFINQITSLVIDTKIPLSLVISMREDFALELDAFKPKLPTLLFENYYRIDKLGEEAAKDAIQIPAQRAGFSYEPALFDQLLKDLLSRDLDRAPSALSEEVTKTVEPPYIQIVCGQLWELEKDNPKKILRLKTYQSKGGAKGLLKNYVNDELSHFSTAEKNIASHAFDHLVSRRGTKMPHTVEDLAQLINKDEKELKRVFEKLTKKRILRSQKRADKIWYELYHDMFSQVIEDWNSIWKTKMRNRRFAIMATSTAAVLLAMYTSFDYYTNNNNYQLLSKNKPNDYLEVYQGQLGSNDLFHQKQFLTEARYQRKDMEPDKCVSACKVIQHNNLNTELITNLPLLERITAYSEDGQFSKAMTLTERILLNKNIKNSTMAVRRLTNIHINKVLPKLAYEMEHNNNYSLRSTIRKNMPIVATTTLIKRKKLNQWSNSNNNTIYQYLRNRTDWVQTEANLKKLIEIEKEEDSYYPRLIDKSLSIAGLLVFNPLNNPFYHTDENKEFMFHLLGKEIPKDIYISKPIQNKSYQKNYTNYSLEKSYKIEKNKFIYTKSNINLLFKKLKSDRPNEKENIIFILKKIKKNIDIKVLISFLSSPKLEVRNITAISLGKIRSSLASKALIKTLTDRNTEVRMSSADALGKIQSTIGIPSLIDLLFDDDLDVRNSAAYALGEIRSTQAVTALIQSLIRIQSDDDYLFQITIIDALRKINSIRGIKEVINSLNHSRLGVQTAAIDTMLESTSLKVVEPLTHLIFNTEPSLEHGQLGELPSKTLFTLSKRYKLYKLEKTLKRIDEKHSIFSPPYQIFINDNQQEQPKIKIKTPQQLVKKIHNHNIPLHNRIEALDLLVKSTPIVAKKTLLKLLSVKSNEADFGARIYPYLSDLNASAALDTIQNRLKKVDIQWQEWRHKRDFLLANSTDKEVKKVRVTKPHSIISPFTYAEAIARLAPSKGIELLEHNLAEARRGAWEGLAQLADVKLVEKLDKTRQANQDNPTLHHATYRAIDLSLSHIEFNMKKKDRDVLDTYLKQLDKAGRIVTSDDLAENDSVALRIEWTRDRIDEGLQSIKRVECRAEHWFKTEWPEEGCP